MGFVGHQTEQVFLVDFGLNHRTQVFIPNEELWTGEDERILSLSDVIFV